MEDERTLGAVVFLILLAISLVGLFWSSRSADRLDGERRQRTATFPEESVTGSRL
ncbi:MAG TPA: hypothetical protein VK146_03595 [Tabrizicola sp.]|nr:hypothetical protein [Tabrizicola sp.]